jgi:endonuclease/exonuclease/phosphatase family metal-dependent hydrolase
VKLVTYNIQYGLGRDGRYDLARIAAEIDGADVIALQEVERFWPRTGMVDQPAELARLLPRYYWVYGANLDMDCSTLDGQEMPVNRRRQFGIMVLARTPILSSRNFPLPKYGALAQHSIQQGLLEAVVNTGSGPIRVYATHLSHLSVDTRMPQIERVLEIMALAPSEGGAWCGGHPDPEAGWTEGEEPPMPRPAVILGDLNFEPGSPEYSRMVGPLTPKYGRLNNREGLVDAWVAAGNPEDSGRTHQGHGRIDHCLATADLAVRIVGCRVDQEATGSDHYPVWVDLDM